jgi:NADPH:quinone reductase-like Zn-dependent oxidoreductase
MLTCCDAFDKKLTYMKALQIKKYGEIREGLAFENVDKPKIQNKDVLLAVKAAFLNLIDYKIVEGKLKGTLTLNLPATVGYDVSGVMAEKGADVSNFEIGDEVYARVLQEQMGTVAEFVALNNELVSLKPENITFEQAFGLPLARLTAIQALESVGFKEDDGIFIHTGSSGVGSFSIQYANAKGAIVYTRTSTKNVDWVKALGADRVIEYKTENYKETATNLDIVFETLGSEYSFDAFWDY